MPRTGFVISNNLSIQLDSSSFTFKPGDAISGTLKYKKFTTDPEHLIKSVSLTFWGRAKTKLIRSNGNGKSIYRGRAMLLNEQISLKRVENVYPEDDVLSAWQFSFVMPVSPVPGDSVWGADSQFESAKTDVAKHKLPPVFYYKGKSGLSSTEKEAYIEYVLSASISLCRADNTSTVSTKSTTIPLMVRHAGTEEPIAEFSLGDSLRFFSVKTLRLSPDKSNASLTFREQMRSTFKPSKIPQFYFQFIVSYPKRIQLSNPRVPFKVHIKPNIEPEWTTIPPSQYPLIKITSFCLFLQSNTFLRCESTFGTTSSDKSDEVTIYNSNLRRNGADELDFILHPESTEPFDLGARLQIAIHRDRATVFGGPITSPSFATSSFRKQLHPTFNTYNVAQTHVLKWKLQFAILGTGKTESVEGGGTTVLLGESEQYFSANEERKFDGRGVKKNYDDASAYGELGLNAVSQILQAVAG